jgi:acyl-CoA reductase-like NAD-dependent aldehyde dehydrogenase
VSRQDIQDAFVSFEVRAANTYRPAFNHHGQVCFSTDRIYVVRSVADKFIEMLKATASNVPVGGAVSQRLAQAAAAKLIDAEKKGAKFLHGSSEFKDKSSATLTPSILTGVTKEMEIFDEESFGPTVAVYTVDDQEEALKLVNASSYGLVGSVFTRDLHRGIDIARRMETGIAHVNGMTAYDECKSCPSCALGTSKILIFPAFSDPSIRRSEEQRMGTD